MILKPANFEKQIITLYKDQELLELKCMLEGSFLSFVQFFYKVVTGRDFIISKPFGRESHFITVSKYLTKAFRLDVNRLILNLPPGYGKSTLVCMWVAWCMAQYPDSRFLYISYNKELSTQQTAFIKSIMVCSEYRLIFGIRLKHDSKAKDFFQTKQGGQVAAFGSNSGVTGRDAGLPGLDRPSGAVIMDDLIKPDEAHSDTIREGVIRNYNETIKQRPRNTRNVPLICIGQRIHEADLPGFLLDGSDGHRWERVVMPALDDNDNALYPEKESAEYLKIERSVNHYTFCSQFQQQPIPSGGALFSRNSFVLLDEEPDMLCTFITVDTAETSKNYNDATVFSFWGYYEIMNGIQPTGKYGLHWIDCVEERVEPVDLEPLFMEFWEGCLRHRKRPDFAAIEKKSTGVTMLSILKDARALSVRPIERNRSSGSKADRFISCCRYVGDKQISLPSYGRHTEMCLNHVAKITANNSHRFDDIADTMADAIHIALVNKTLYYQKKTSPQAQAIGASLYSSMNANQNYMRNL